MKQIITTLALIASFRLCNAQTPVLDSSLQRYYVPINDTVIVEGRPPATRLYVYTTTDLLYGFCTIAWHLSYNEEGNTYTLTGGQVQMGGNYYVQYAADNRNIVHLFQYAGNYIGVIIK